MFARIFITLLSLALIIPTAFGQTRADNVTRSASPDEEAARRRLEQAQKVVQRVRQSISAAQTKQDSLTDETDRLRDQIAEAQTTLRENTASVEKAKVQQDEMASKVAEAEFNRKQSESDMETRRAAFDQGREQALTAFEQTPDYLAQVKVHQDAQAKAVAAEKAVLDALRDTPAYKTAVATRDAADQALTQARSTGDQTTLTAASQSALDAKNKVSVLEDQASAADAALTAARSDAKEALDKLVAARVEAERTWLVGPEAAQIKQDADAAEKTYLDWTRQKTAAEEERASMDRKLQKMNSELAQRKRQLESAESTVKSNERDIRQFETRLRELERDLSRAVADARDAQNDLSRAQQNARNNPR